MNENKKISQLEVATESKNTDIIPIVQDGTNKQMTKELLLGDNYSKKEVDAKITEVNNTITQVDAKFTGKADKATTLQGYGITDAYTKEEAGKVFITKAVDDLVNYYLKSETYSKEEVNALVDTIPKFAITVVSSLPTSNISATTIYLVKTDDEGNNIFTEYIYTNNKWEVLGSQKIDITNYYTKEEVDNLFTNLNISNYYTKSEVDALLAKKAAKEIVVVGEENATDDTIIILDDDEFNNIGSEVYIGPTEPTTGEKIWIEQEKNLLNKNTITSGYGIAMANGAVYEDYKEFATDYINVEGLDYVCWNRGGGSNNRNNWGAFYDANKNYIADSGYNSDAFYIAVPSGAVYFRTNFQLADLEDVIIQKGTKVTASIKIRNNDGRYVDAIVEEPLEDITDKCTFSNCTFIGGKILVDRRKKIIYFQTAIKATVTNDWIKVVDLPEDIVPVITTTNGSVISGSNFWFYKDHVVIGGIEADKTYSLCGFGLIQ